MLKRRPKRRYLSIMHTGTASDAITIVTKRCSELFGSIAAEKAAIRLMKSEDGATIMKCRLDQLDSVLVAIALADPPMATLDMSGSIKQLRRRH
jgi:RNase P/RNase MRP subunit POP5